MLNDVCTNSAYVSIASHSKITSLTCLVRSSQIELLVNNNANRQIATCLCSHSSFLTGHCPIVFPRGEFRVTMNHGWLQLSQSVIPPSPKRILPSWRSTGRRWAAVEIWLQDYVSLRKKWILCCKDEACFAKVNPSLCQCAGPRRQRGTQLSFFWLIGAHGAIFHFCNFSIRINRVPSPRPLPKQFTALHARQLVSKWKLRQD